jgi:hydroxypyruvate reductase
LGKDAAEVRAIKRIIRAVLKASDPRTLLPQKLSLRKESLKAGRLHYNLSHYRHIYVVGAGKASGAMAGVLERILGDRITDGVVVVKHGHAVPVSRIRILEAAHPVPDRDGMNGAREILSLLRKAGEKDLVVVLLSGGGSALMPLPVEGVTLAQKKLATQLLLRSGATINEINVVRKHLSRVKGGRLLLHAAPARVLTLILSDVLGNSLDTIASGPTFPDPSTYGDAIQILKKYRLWKGLPKPVRDHLVHGDHGLVEETLKIGNPAFKKARHLIIGDHCVALKAAVQAARASGYRTHILTPYLKGEAREAAQAFTSFAYQLHKRRHGTSHRTCLLASGETTVTVRGQGKGGRCQEFVLAAALKIIELPGTVVAAFGTDGTDGPTDAAGAYADENTVHKAVQHGLDPVKALHDHNSFPFFKALDQLIITGPTCTNLNDLYMLFTASSEKTQREGLYFP